MTGTKRNARVMAALRLLVVGILMLALAVALTGTVAAFDRNPGKEFGKRLYYADNHRPQGLWSDGTTMWVADWEGDKLYAWDLDGKAWVAAKDFNGLKAAGNEDPTGIWSDGSTMWVADWEDDKLYAYLTGSRAWDPSRDFDTLRAAGNRAPTGVWSDGTTLWVADDGDDKLYSYDLASKARVPARDFNTLAAAGNNDPRGIWSDERTMWVADVVDDKLYAYDLASKERVPARDFETLQTAGNHDPQGIWSDGDTIWVADWDDARRQYGNSTGIYAYNMPEDTAYVEPTDPVADPAAFDRNPGKEFGKRLYYADNHRPQGLWSDGTTMWVADWEGDKLYAWDLDGKAWVAAKDFNGLKAAGNEDPTGIWSDGSTMWVADWEDDKLYAYLTGSRAWDPSRDFDTLRAAGNRAPTGVWSDGTTLWVADDGDDKLYSYDLASKARVPARDFNTLAAAGNNDPRGIWSDERTMWVADVVDDKLYAYDLASKERVPARDFETLQTAGNHDPQGIWSDGDTIWVADWDDARRQYGNSTGIYAYNMPPPPLPGPPAIASVSPGPGSLTVSWRAPSSAASGITAYDLRHIRTDADETVDANWTVMDGVRTGAGPLRYTLAGLDGGVQYDVQARAVNAVGRGPWSDTATGTTELQPNKPPVFSAIRSIPENATAGHPVGAPFTATDPDGDPLSFALSGADSNSFAIGRTSGQITLAEGVVLDYEAKASYAVTVTVTDGNGLAASIAVTINVTVAGVREPSSSCVQPLAVDGGAAVGSWGNDCPSVNKEGSYARYYTFALSEESQVSITLESEEDTYLFLLEGSGTSGGLLHKDDDYPGGGTDSQIMETLSAGSYTIEATTYDAETTGGFTLSVETVEDGNGGPPGPRPVEPTGCVETVSRDGSVSGEWSSGCQSQVSGRGYARYYTFTLARESEVTITLARESGDADTYLYLRSGEARSGDFLHENDDDGGTSRSQIAETLAAGTYTIEATTYEAGQTGSFTLTVSGLGSATTATDSCVETLSANGSVIGEWKAGCDSVAKAGSHARFYVFTLEEDSEVTITLELRSGEADTYLYLREGENTRSGDFLYENDDEGGTTRSQIQETLDAGTYTIEATTYEAGQTGIFTLTVSGL